MKISDILVPTDLSLESLHALELALSLAGDEGEVCLLHVVDKGFIEQMAEEGFASEEVATARLREKAEQRLQEIVAAVPDPKPQIEPMVVVGRPFTEVLRIAGDLDFGMIVLATRGRRGADLEEMLFGSTAEKLIRASRVPVVCVPTA